MHSLRLELRFGERHEADRAMHPRDLDRSLLFAHEIAGRGDVEWRFDMFLSLARLCSNALDEVEDSK